MIKIKPGLEEIKESRDLMNPKKTKKWPLYFNWIGESREQDSFSQYNFLIVNSDKRKIASIYGILHGQVPNFATVDEENIIDGRYKNLYYKYVEMALRSAEGDAYKIRLIGLAEAYNGSIEKDERLYSRKGLEDYIEKKIEKELERMKKN